MLPAELIARKRDGEELPADALRAFLDGFLDGRIPDHQVAALLMAICFRGLGDGELATLTRAMIESGERLSFRDGGAPAVDKHSTGGVGDKVSLVLAPLVAEAGLRVPMMSGRGLGHTGGTLDKLGSIPGFRTGLGLDAFRRVLDAVGCAMIGQTEEIAPLDGRLYALRDATGTVPSIPLIASSIVSKKVAEGIEALVLDVKCGRGAFMTSEEEALELARALVRLAGREGVRATALVTSMEAPLGVAVGNALEVREAIAALRGGGPPDLREITVSLAAELLTSRGVAESRPAAERRLGRLLDGGGAADRFARLVEAQGGDPSVVVDPDRLPAAPVRREWGAEREGRVTAVDAREIGWAAVELGAGRRRPGDPVDPAVGFEVRVAPGDRVRAGEALVGIHAADAGAAETAERRLRRAVRIASPEEAPPEEPPRGAAPRKERPGEAAARGAARSRLLHRVTAEGTELLSRP